MRVTSAIIAVATAFVWGLAAPRAQSMPPYPVTDCSQLTVQMELNRCAGANYEAADAALNTVYRKLMAAEADAASRQRLTGSERAWIAYRDKECADEVGPQRDGGSIWPMEMSNCLEKLTAARIRELSKLHGCTADASACGVR
jgi:uncharacterized protein YecT (DUF1311 family)